MPTDGIGTTQIGDLTKRGRRRLAAFAIVRTVATIALVLVLYFLLPLGGGASVEKVVKLTLGALMLTAIIIWQVHQIVDPTTRSAGPSKRWRSVFRFTCCSSQRPTL